MPVSDCRRVAPTGHRRDLAGAAAADGCLIKGNINVKGEKIYHLPGDDSYDDTVITAAKGERFFCSEADAIAAGWRAAKTVTGRRLGYGSD